MPSHKAEGHASDSAGIRPETVSPYMLGVISRLNKRLEAFKDFDDDMEQQLGPGAGLLSRLRPSSAIRPAFQLRSTGFNCASICTKVCSTASLDEVRQELRRVSRARMAKANRYLNSAEQADCMPSNLHHVHHILKRWVDEQKSRPNLRRHDTSNYSLSGALL